MEKTTPIENIIEFGDNRATMKKWAEQGVKVQTCITSPPYYGLRDYGTAKWEGGNDPNCQHIKDESKTKKFGNEEFNKNAPSREQTKTPSYYYEHKCELCGATKEDGQLGMEKTPEEFIENMVDVFRHVKNILADDGTLWINIGDSYAGSNSVASNNGRAGFGNTREKVVNRTGDGIKPKDLIGIPWMLAFALRQDGWYLRQDIIWHKPNPIPESVKDRCTKSHEYIFLLSKQERYYFNYEAIKEPLADESRTNFQSGSGSFVVNEDHKDNDLSEKSKNVVYDSRNKRDVWSVNVRPYKGAHFATYPMELIEPCVLAGSKPGDIVLDPFMGSGTTAQVAKRHDRKYLGCELNPNYGSLQEERIKSENWGDPVNPEDPIFKFE